jgi:hypothetical protein
MGVSAATAAARALKVTREALKVKLVEAIAGETTARLALTVSQVEVGRVINLLAATFDNPEQTTAQNRRDFNEWAQSDEGIPRSYSGMRTYMNAATFADRMPGAEEATGGNVQALNYLSTFELDHASSILEEAGPEPDLAALKEAATKVVPSLKPDPTKEAKQKRDAAIRAVDKAAEAFVPFVKDQLKEEAKVTTEAGRAALRAIWLRGVTQGGNNGPSSVVAAKKLLRAADSAKKQRDEEAADRAAAKEAKQSGGVGSLPPGVVEDQ